MLSIILYIKNVKNNITNGMLSFGKKINFVLNIFKLTFFVFLCISNFLNNKRDVFLSTFR